MDNSLIDRVKQIFEGGMSAGQIIFSIVLVIAIIYAQVLIFRKAGEPGIAAIIPVYSTYILTKSNCSGPWIILKIIFWVFNIETEFSQLRRW